MKIEIQENDLNVSVSEIKNENFVKIFKLTADNPCNAEIKTVRLVFEAPSKGAFSVWNPCCEFFRAVMPNWNKTQICSRISSGAPVQQLITADGSNAVNIAVLDAKTPLNIKTGFVEETGNIQCYIEFFTLPVKKFLHYETWFRIDERKIPYYDCLADVTKWWETEGGYIRNSVPDIAKMPVYSVWYSFHQDIDVEKIIEECRAAKTLGMESVIIDDGWQTDNNDRGYAYCGDWEVTPAKIPDMAEFVRKIHNEGLKFILWYSVPFVGIHSKAYKKFEGKFLSFDDKNGYGSLDPRYPEVREYLAGLYEKAVLDWDIDGLKLDFIDSFVLEDKEKNDEAWDIFSLEEAVEALLIEIKKRIYALKPDFCFEFRQRYMGPAVATLGNMIRVGDCPGDALKNRVGSIDLRLISSNSAVHSDMLMWDLKCPAQTAALQIINTIFAVPQISVMLNELPQKHLDMLKFYLDFWIKNRYILLDGKLEAHNPEANYSLVASHTDDEIIAVAYSEKMLVLKKDYKRIVIINGTGQSVLVINSFVSLKGYKCTVRNCFGEIVCETVLEDTYVLPFDVEPAGIVELMR